MTALHSIRRTGKTKGEPGRRVIKMNGSSVALVTKLRSALPDSRIAFCHRADCNTLVGVGTSDQFLTVDGVMLQRDRSTPLCPKCGQRIWSKQSGR